MAINYNDLAINGIKGCRFQRINPDGTQPKVERTVGGAGTFDMSGASDISAIPMTIKFDNGTAETKNVNLTAAVDDSAVTVAEVVTALTTAAFTNLTATTEAVTGYLKLDGSASGADYMQVYGELAGLVGIGTADGLSSTSQLGTKIIGHFNDTISVSESPNIKEGEEIELESGDGTLRTLITDDILKGENPVITLATNDYELEELITGGVYDSTNRIFTPRSETDTVSPRFYVETFAPMYDDGTSKTSDKLSYEQKIYYSCTGSAGELSKEAKAWVNKVYNLKATGYTDENGVRQGSYTKQQLTLTEFSALDVENV